MDHIHWGGVTAGLSFDTAIRMYLESFRLPGEAQKINRIMETFGMHYHRQCPDIFRNADAVYVLAYSVIILNTDQHNNQVRCIMAGKAEGAPLPLAVSFQQVHVMLCI